MHYPLMPGDNKPFQITDLNLWRTHRKGVRFIFAWIGISACSIFMYFFGFNMNIVPVDCWYVTYYVKSDPTMTPVTILNNRNATGSLKN